MVYDIGVIRAIQKLIRDCIDHNQDNFTKLYIEDAMLFLSPLESKIPVCQRITTYWRDFLLKYTVFGVSLTDSGVPSLLIRYENGPLLINISGSSLKDFKFSENINQTDCNTDLARQIIGDLKTIFEQVLGIQFPTSCHVLETM